MGPKNPPKERLGTVGFSKQYLGYLKVLDEIGSTKARV